jgi:elongation factor 2
VTLTKPDRQLNQDALKKRVLQAWIPAGKVVLEMMIFRLPSPATAQKYCFNSLYKGRMEDRYAKDF